jgi:hypothetical protein
MHPSTHLDLGSPARAARLQPTQESAAMPSLRRHVQAAPHPTEPWWWAHPCTSGAAGALAAGSRCPRARRQSCPWPAAWSPSKRQPHCPAAQPSCSQLLMPACCTAAASRLDGPRHGPGSCSAVPFGPWALQLLPAAAPLRQRRQAAAWPLRWAAAHAACPAPHSFIHFAGSACRSLARTSPPSSSAPTRPSTITLTHSTW